ncbi:uncharacterized protein LOC131653508 [Vicia villosa]|uniref:uncharacterized protein LOC131653508 n=1 Tax=Vicia villosa TaxID=3911 RepID=UPI00273AF06A|nr:uncharacterized protein LOC131653508 [Vicia villosa]
MRSLASSSSRGVDSGSRVRKKHKKLDAICEEEYNRNHGELNEGDNLNEEGSGVRRSSRVRRVPVVLDASPSPKKKRQRLGKDVMVKSVEGDKNLGRENGGSVGLRWSLRSRSRGKNVSFEVEERELPRRKRKLFDEELEVIEVDKNEELEGDRKEELEVVEVDKNEELEVVEGDRKVELEVVEGDGKEELEVDKKVELKGYTRKRSRSKRMGKFEATKYVKGLEENECQAVELVVVLNQGEGSASVPETELADENPKDLRDENAASEMGNEERIETDNLQAEECSGNVEPSLVEHVETVDEQGDQVESEKEEKDASDEVEIAGVSTKQVDNEGSVDKEVHIEENISKDENIGRKDELKQASKDKSGYRCIKEGRRCGLCGRGSDGKPPKRLTQDKGESENEAYSGSSASEQPTYDTWDGFDDEPGWLGRLLGPINDRYGIAGIWVHQNCAVWSPEVYFAGLGCLKNVRAALCRGRALKCTRCGRRGATIGCRVDRCPKTYHLACARANGCIFDHRKFLIACTDHLHLFQPCGNKYLVRIKKLRARKMMWETRKRSNDASRKDIDAEERWLENCGEDEEFLKRENKRLQRDLLRIAPMYIGGSDSAGSENSFQGWESVAGLKDVIRCMKEVVIIPLLYPDFFDNLGLTPPRGVLLHGYPGTGKTLVVRSLIGACARGDRRIAYFARKGADCLGKYVGDAERQLRLLFQVAEKCQPSIIFFDEIDGLAPCRTPQQDQTHSSVVSTLLALMDGLKSRGSVVVIGATNRPDAVDPALRRPGRFDREIYFPLPSTEDRASILSLHTQKWPKPISGSLLGWIAKKTSGFAGADLQALCTQAAMNALKRNFPLQKVLSVAEKRNSSGCKNTPLPSFTVEERDWVEAFSSSPLPCSQREAGNAANDVVCSPLPVQLIPCLLRPLCTILVSLYLDKRLWLPLPISKAMTLIKDVIISALDKKKMPIDHWWLHLDDFLQETNVAYEISKCLSFSGILSANHGFSGSCDIVDHADDKPSMKNHVNLCNGRLPDMGMTNKSGFRILIYGNPRSGQRHLASCLLYCFIGNIEVQKIDMATISQEGHGDIVQGIAQILMKCASMKSCVIFMPRIDLWAVEEDFKTAEKTDSCSINQLSSAIDKSCFPPSQIVEKENGINTGKHPADMIESQSNKKASYAWMTFIEQVESIGLSTSLMILATSEIPYPELPHKIRGFFKSYQSKDRQSAPTVQTVPQFSLQIDENFDHDLAINLSAIELLRNVTEQRIQLIHQRSHSHMGVQKLDRAFESIEVCKDNVTQRKENEPGHEKKGEGQFPESLAKVPQPNNSRSLKGKSNLLMAISTFGYQILLYPHFAELCWVTSKLKEGPCSDVSGPWKGWPFNSCIIRPTNSQDKVVISSSSGGTKSKESAGLVRGLVAVGLSAYKGVYKSVREVSLEIRKVLEILTETINMKIRAGRNRHQYLRILSQVAYLEDMVNNWAYGLLSLDQASPELAAKVIPAAAGSLNSHLECEDRHIAEGEDCHLVSPAGGDDLETLEKSPKGVPTVTTEQHSLNEINDNLGDTDCEGQRIHSEGSPHNHRCPDTNIIDSCLVNQSLHPSLNQENGVLSGVSESVTAENHEAAGGELGISKDLNKSTCTRPTVISENGFHTCEQENIEIGNSKSSDVESDKHENTLDINARSSKDSGPDESGVVCFYQCCPHCLRSLYHLTRKILVREWGSNRSHWTIEDVHDAVSTLSVDLISAVRKCYMAEEKTFTDLSNSKTFVEYSNLTTCTIENRGKDVVPAECVSHLASQDASGSEDALTNEPVKLDLKFVFRDGVLVPMDPAKDTSLHCKFEKLCLCSLIELVVKTNCPLN